MPVTAVATRARVEGWRAALHNVKARWSGFYALDIYLPTSRLGRWLQERKRSLLDRTNATSNSTRLPQVPWAQVLSRLPIRLVETRRRDGNVNLAELAILAQAASSAPPGSQIIEIGTFDGRTAINFAVNAPDNVSILTLDLPVNQQPVYSLAASEQRYVDKRAPGERFSTCEPAWRTHADRITQLLGDSASFDWSSNYGRAGLVFVDGSHTYQYACKDSDTALRLVKPEGVVLWHDYGGVWEGVTRALEELEATRKLGLRRIQGTSLVFWRAPPIASHPVTPVSR